MRRNASRVCSTVATPSSVRAEPSATTPTTLAGLALHLADQRGDLRRRRGRTPRPACAPPRRRPRTRGPARRRGRPRSRRSAPAGSSARRAPVIVVTIPPISPSARRDPRSRRRPRPRRRRRARIALGRRGGGGDALAGDLARLLGGLGGGERGLRAGAGGAVGLLHGVAGGLDHAHLALGALGDVGDGAGDLADGAAGLLGGARDLLEPAETLPGAARDLRRSARRARCTSRCRPSIAALGLGEHRVEGGARAARARRCVRTSSGVVVGVAARVKSPPAAASRPSVSSVRQCSSRLRRRDHQRAHRADDAARDQRPRCAVASSSETTNDDQQQARARRSARPRRASTVALRRRPRPSPAAASIVVNELVHLRADLAGVEVARAGAVLGVADGLGARLARARRPAPCSTIVACAMKLRRSCRVARDERRELLRRRPAASAPHRP